MSRELTMARKPIITTLLAANSLILCHDREWKLQQCQPWKGLEDPESLRHVLVVAIVARFVMRVSCAGFRRDTCRTGGMLVMGRSL
jgi:hypothetical protein